ncbi:DUF6327 family protein [Pseudozobellia thermophila]|uniref:Uncharacterized protein n=1 Tax=Pseudozobellia thermophila TaxID=192903 RepID=A0A1M6IK48_9FLAO|nr:DUF6327 family protein [Pseudozobellia thermophila]SHJ34861.1 hypothetical protein SAMN04488513_10417 [Pseudozobellia thermophila]
MPKEYTSFEEIDRRLKILELQRKIDQENLKLHFRQAKVGLVPKKVFQGLGAAITQNHSLKSILVAYVAKKVLGLLRRKKGEEKDPKRQTP